MYFVVYFLQILVFLMQSVNEYRCLFFADFGIPDAICQ